MAKATTKTATKATKKGVAKEDRSPEHVLRMDVSRAIGRGVWLTGYNSEFPDATGADRKLAWKEARKDFTKIGLKALKSIEKNGFKVIEDPEAPKA